MDCVAESDSANEPDLADRAEPLGTSAEWDRSQPARLGRPNRGWAFARPVASQPHLEFQGDQSG